MGNTAGPPRDTWAAYIRAAREAAGLDKTELGRRIGKDRITITRWESGKGRPRTADLAALVAQVLGLDVDETLAAAGMRPGVTPPAEPTLPPDPERDLIMASPVPDSFKRTLLERLHAMRERDQRRRLEDLTWMLDQEK